MAGELCSQATCGYCGRCDAAYSYDSTMEPEVEDYVSFTCFWCGQDVLENQSENEPYCSLGCAIRAQQESIEDKE